MINKKENRKSAEVCNSFELTASQRINAKELWYILGLIEGEGSLSCYKEDSNISAEIIIELHLSDIKLLYWIKRQLGVGSISVVHPKDVARLSIKSKNKILEIINIWENPLTKVKKIYLFWLKSCLDKNLILPKPSLDSLSATVNLGDNKYIKDWIVGFIEAKGSFNLNKNLIAGFNITQKNDKELLKTIGDIIGLSDIKDNKLTAISLVDIQAVITFMTNPERVRLKGIKRVKFLKWIKEMRNMPRYAGLKIPEKY